MDFREAADSAYQELLAACLPPAPVDIPIPPERKPRFESDFVEVLNRQIKAAYDERDRLLMAGLDAKDVQKRIRDLKKQLRAGQPLQAGDVLWEGRFELVEAVGEGGFGKVWKAWDRNRRELVAIKVLHGRWLEDRIRRDRLFRGAKQMARLRHPNVVGVLEERLAEDNYHFFVMEFVPGSDQ